AVWPKDEAPPVPVAGRFPSGQAMIGWSPASFEGSSLAVLGRGPHGFAVHAFGEEIGRAERLAENVMQWDAVGRPDSRSLALQVHPASEPIPDTEGQVKIEKQWTTILIAWPGT